MATRYSTRSDYRRHDYDTSYGRSERGWERAMRAVVAAKIVFSSSAQATRRALVVRR